MGSGFPYNGRGEPDARMIAISALKFSHDCGSEPLSIQHYINPCHCRGFLLVLSLVLLNGQ